MVTPLLLSGDVELIPTCYITSDLLSHHEDARLKNVSLSEYRHILRQLTVEKWAQHGFANVPLLPDSLHFRPRDISNAMLEFLIQRGVITDLQGRQHWRETGYRLVSEKEVRIASQCCTSWGDLGGWEYIADYRENTWISLWIGHPWVMARYWSDKIQLSDYTEQPTTILHTDGTVEHPEPNYEPLYEIDPAVLSNLAMKAQAEVDEFTDRLQQLWIMH